MDAGGKKKRKKKKKRKRMKGRKVKGHLSDKPQDFQVGQIFHIEYVTKTFYLHTVNVQICRLALV